jgi:hypothetical protein
MKKFGPNPSLTKVFESYSIFAENSIGDKLRLSKQIHRPFPRNDRKVTPSEEKLIILMVTAHTCKRAF